MRILLVFFMFFSAEILFAQSDCTPSAIVFRSGETLTYEVYYHWGFVWANAGEAVFALSREPFQDKASFHISGTGTTYKNYDWFYKVRDKFESWVDTASMRPFRYTRNSNEGSTHVYNDNYFNQHANIATCYTIVKGQTKKDTVKINACTFDVMTMIYYARCIDYSQYKPDTKIPISLYLDGEVYNKLYIRYGGKEKIKTAVGEFNCIRFKPLLIPGTIFSGGEEMTVWVTDDERKVPVLIRTPIVVGEVQVKIKTIKN